MDNKYYTINEIIKQLGKKNIEVDIENLQSCIRKEIMKPIFYISGMPAFAFEKIDDGVVAITGLCFLSGHFDAGMGASEVFESLIHPNDKISYKIEKDQLSKMKVYGWQYDKDVFHTVSASGYRIHPKAQPADQDIPIFLLKEKLTLNNVLISKDEIPQLITYLKNLEDIVSTSNPENNGMLPREENNLLVGIGYLATMLSKCSPKFKHGDKPNATQIKDAILEMAKEDNLLDQVELKSFNKTISEGLSVLYSIKQ